MAERAERMVEDLYKRIQLPPEWVKRLEAELEAEIVDRLSVAAELRVGLTGRLAALADERQKLLKAYYANAIPLALLKQDQDRITAAEQKARRELEVAEADLSGWQEVLSLSIRLAGNCRDAYSRRDQKCAAGSTRRSWKTCISRGPSLAPPSPTSSRLFFQGRV